MSKSYAPSSSHNAVRGVAASSAGVALGAGMTIILPWMALPTAFSAYQLYRNAKKLKQQRHELAEHHMTIKKRNITRQTIEGLTWRGFIAFVTIGADEVVALTQAGVSNLLSHGASNAAGHLAEFGAADTLRTGTDVIGWTSEAASAPVTHMQDFMGLDTAADVTQAGHGWYADSAEVAQEVIGVGSVQTLTEKLMDTAAKPGVYYLDTQADKRDVRRR
ncbi:MAG: hypothetical protein M1814_000518 [Vezdaea aestivalis]|nr:MAG: hypothetical protein M1814_000518 [Vezdaea aestivalis]